LATFVAGVTVIISPLNQTVAPGSEFEVSIQVTAAGSPFNAFDAYVGFDPAALTPVPLSPISLQEGSYFTGGCGNRFHIFAAGSDRDTVTDVLLCSGASLTGPGQIYRLRFRASSTPQVTYLRFLPGLAFYNEGVKINSVTTGDAHIGIGMPAGVGDARPSGLRLTAAPNPSHSRGTTFSIEMDRAGDQRVLVCDLQGRVVRHLQNGFFPAGSRTVSWDGRNDSGVVVPPGVYLGMLKAGGKTLKARLTLLN